MDIGLVVTGSISKLGSLYTLNMQLISTRGTNLGVIQRASDKCSCNEEELVGFAERVALKLIGKEPKQVMALPAIPSSKIKAESEALTSSVPPVYEPVPGAKASLYKYTDERGVMHFTTLPVTKLTEVQSAALTHHEDGAQNQKKYLTKLYVQTQPQEAQIRILNIGPKFEQGMELEAGKYHIEVSAAGYTTQKRWEEVLAGEIKRLKFILTASQTEETAILESSVLLNKAMQAETANSPQEAIYWYKQVLQLDKNNHGACNNLAILLEKQGNRKEAIAYYEQAVAFSPLNVGYHLNLADAYEKNGQLEEAAAAYEALVARDKKNKKAWEALAVLHERTKNPRKALASYQALSGLEPKNTVWLLKTAGLYEQTGNVAKARDTYKAVLDINPQHAQARKKYVELSKKMIMQ